MKFINDIFFDKIDGVIEKIVFFQALEKINPEINLTNNMYTCPVQKQKKTQNLEENYSPFLYKIIETILLAILAHILPLKPLIFCIWFQKNCAK